MHRYCYIIWLHRTGDPQMWSQESLKFLLPFSRKWDMWWAQQQLCAQDISEISFSEEYAIMLVDPLADSEGKQIKNELDNIQRRIKQSDLSLGTELPPPHAWYEHDAYVDAAECLPTMFCCVMARDTCVLTRMMNFWWRWSLLKKNQDTNDRGRRRASDYGNAASGQELARTWNGYVRQKHKCFGLLSTCVHDRRRFYTAANSILCLFAYVVHIIDVASSNSRNTTITCFLLWTSTFYYACQAQHVDVSQKTGGQQSIKN